MIIDAPSASQISHLRKLWKEAFGDSDAFLDVFFHRAFSPQRCRCIIQGGEIPAALYWFDCSWEGKRLAYFYAVATARESRGQGLCRKLMEDTHRHLAALGYDGCILCPQSEGLFAMYGKLGYKTCNEVREFTCTAAGSPISLTPVNPEEYAAARRQLLPAGSVLQEGATLEFLSVYAQLYVGDNIVLAAYPNEGKLMACEFLGDRESSPRVLRTLGFAEGFFRTPGQGRPFAMYRSLTENTDMPNYLGLALD